MNSHYIFQWEGTKNFFTPIYVYASLKISYIIPNMEMTYKINTSRILKANKRIFLVYVSKSIKIIKIKLK